MELGDWQGCFKNCIVNKDSSVHLPPPPPPPPPKKKKKKKTLYGYMFVCGAFCYRLCSVSKYQIEFVKKVEERDGWRERIALEIKRMKYLKSFRYGADVYHYIYVFLLTVLFADLSCFIYWEEVRVI
jgi:hypothetical protein